MSSEPFHKLIPDVKMLEDLERNFVKMAQESMRILFCILQWRN